MAIGQTQSSEIFVLLNAATTNTSAVQDTAGYNGALQLEVRETAGGTVTLAIQGSFDGSNFYNVGYQQVDNLSSLSRAVGTLSVTANMAHVYQLLDPYPVVKVTTSSISGATLTVKLYGMPV